MPRKLWVVEVRGPWRTGWEATELVGRTRDDAIAEREEWIEYNHGFGLSARIRKYVPAEVER